MLSDSDRNWVAHSFDWTSVDFEIASDSFVVLHEFVRDVSKSQQVRESLRIAGYPHALADLFCEYGKALRQTREFQGICAIDPSSARISGFSVANFNANVMDVLRSALSLWHSNQTKYPLPQSKEEWVVALVREWRANYAASGFEEQLVMY